MTVMRTGWDDETLVCVILSSRPTAGARAYTPLCRGCIREHSQAPGLAG